MGVALFHRLLVVLGALLLFAAPAMAHPHIFIDAKATVVFDKDGAVSEIRHDWTFDEAYSAWAIQGLDTNNDGKTSQDELQGLADDNMKGLAEYEFYTFAGEGDTNLKFTAAADPHIVYENGHTILRFGIKPEAPYHIKKALELAINDPEYYVAITFADTKQVSLENAPDGCSVHINPPQEMPPDIADQLYALPSDVTVLPPELAKALRGVQGAIIISCPGPGPLRPLWRATARKGARPAAHRHIRRHRRSSKELLCRVDRHPRPASHRQYCLLAAGRVELSLWHYPRRRSRSWQGGHRLLCAGQ
jgi:nickel/cobalt exporter